MRVLSAAAVAELVSLADVLPVVERAFVRQGRGQVERPERPHFPVGVGLPANVTADDSDDGPSGRRDERTDERRGDPTSEHGESTDGERRNSDERRRPDPAGTGLAMPAYLHGDETYATKLVGVHPENADRGLPTIHAQLVVSDAATDAPRLLAAAERVTNVRTGAIGGLAVRELAPGEGPVTLGVLGAGTQARWQTRAVAATRGVDTARVFSPTPVSRRNCAADLRERGIDARAVESSRAAVTDADVVVTATTASDPVFPGAALAADALVVAVGAYSADTRELDRTTFDRASRVFADVPEEVADVGDVRDNAVDPARLRPLSDAFDPRVAVAPIDGIAVVESVGTAVLDAAVGELLADRAATRDAGRVVRL